VELHLHPYVLLSTEKTHHLLYIILRTKYLLVMLLHNRAYQGDGDKRDIYMKSKLQKTASFTAVETLDVPPEHTHILPTALIHPKGSRG